MTRTVPPSRCKPLGLVLGLILLASTSARSQSVVTSTFAPSAGSGYSNSYYSMLGSSAISVDSYFVSGGALVVPFTVPAGVNYQLGRIELVAALPWVGTSGYPIHAYVVSNPMEPTWPYPHTAIDYKSATKVTFSPKVIVFDASTYPAVTLYASKTYYLKIVGTELTNVDPGPLNIYQNSVGKYGPAPVAYINPSLPAPQTFPTNPLYPAFRIYGACSPVNSFKINGNSAQTIDILAPGYPIVLDGAGCKCVSGYFVSVQLSDPWWNRYGPEAMRWLTASDFAAYGPISNFNVRKFAEDQWFQFVPGQYYRVKLAVGPGWIERSVLIHIKP